MQRTTKRETGSGAEKAGSDRDQKNLEKRRESKIAQAGSDLNSFWTVQPSSRNSWLVNKLLKLRGEIYHWIKLRIGNGNWSPFGSLKNFLANDSNFSLGIQASRCNAVLALHGQSLDTSTPSLWQTAAASSVPYHPGIVIIWRLLRMGVRR